MKKTYRLTKNYQYKYVYKKGSVVTNKTLTLIFVKNNSETPKFGFNITTKYGKATKRNKLRRQLKSVCQQSAPDLQKGYYIFKPRFDWQNTPTFLQLTLAATELLSRTQTKTTEQK